MASTLTLDAVKLAWERRDPQFPELVAQLSTQADPKPETPIHEGAVTFESWLAYLKSPQFLRKSKEEQRSLRVEKLKLVESPDNEVPLPERLKAHEAIYSLWQSDDPLARDALLRVIDEVPLVYGPWRALKRVFKEAESKNDTEVMGALSVRFDLPNHKQRSVSSATLGYLSRRAWRYLRRVAVQLPATYADAAVDFLIRYPQGTETAGTWVLNHVLFHNSKKYGRSGFTFAYGKQPRPGEWKNRAYSDLWTRSPRPLFTLLERAHSDAAREFAAAGLKSDFKASLRDVEPAWVARLVGVESAAVDEFVVWILQNVPKFEQGAFRKLGLHDAVLRMLNSASASAATYAADYARTHARDLSVDELVLLFASQHEPTRKLARDLLSERDPRTGVGLEAWGRLLETPQGSAFASEVLIKSFGARELTPAWFADRLLSPSDAARKFAQDNLVRIHKAKELGAKFFADLIRRTEPRNRQQAVLARWAVEQIAKLDFAGLSADDLRWLTLYPLTAGELLGQMLRGALRPQALGMDFVKILAYRLDWDGSQWLVDFRAANGAWAKELDFDENRAQQLLNLLGDVRAFSTADLGVDWLLKLAGRAEPLYHDFARDRMVRTLGPADFAPASGATPVATTAAPVAVDLAKKSFVFTGTLATMRRDEAEAKVKAANGTVAGSVSKNLAYLVIGDEGSPLYGSGKKGSKQVKAEQLNEAGANVAIISETAFFQMLAGTAPATAADGGATARGTERLLAMATAPGAADAPLAAFARDYLKKHHKPIAVAATGKPPDPGTEIPPELLSWQRFGPLFAETRKPLRDFALEFAATDFARWNPDADDLLTLSESHFIDVRRFAAKALLAEVNKESQGYRVDATKLDAAAVYRFVESGEQETRALGLELIRRRPALAVPEELFRLTESPDRAVRAFVIHSLWGIYRDRGLTEGWMPPLPPTPTVGAKAKKDAAKREAERGPGVPVPPANPPAGVPTLARFLRRVLFELPPGPPEKSRGGGEQQGEAEEGKKRVERQVSLVPIPAHRAKREAVVTLPRPGPRRPALRRRHFATAGRVPGLGRRQRARGEPGRRHPHPPPVPVTRGRGSLSVDHFSTYRGDLRAASASEGVLQFVTEHPEGLPTALYRLSAETNQLAETALPCGGRSVALAGATTYVGGSDGRVYACAHDRQGEAADRAVRRAGCCRRPRFQRPARAGVRQATRHRLGRRRQVDPVVPAARRRDRARRRPDRRVARRRHRAWHGRGVRRAAP